ASAHAGPQHGSPLPVVFSGSQGNSPIAAAFKAPRALILSMVGLWPGAGTSLPAQADAASRAANPATAACLMRLEIRMFRSLRLVFALAAGAGRPLGVGTPPRRAGPRRLCSPLSGGGSPAPQMRGP